MIRCSGAMPGAWCGEEARGSLVPLVVFFQEQIMGVHCPRYKMDFCTTKPRLYCNVKRICRRWVGYHLQTLTSTVGCSFQSALHASTWCIGSSTWISLRRLYPILCFLDQPESHPSLPGATFIITSSGPTLSW